MDAVMRARSVGLLLVSLVVLAGCTARGAADSPSPTPEPSPSPTRQLNRTGGVGITEPVVSLAPWERPYPYTTPTPPERATAIDGTYLRVVSLERAGGAELGLPIRCFRCIPFRVDAGVSILILFEGSYYLHHHLSGFRTMGHYFVSGNRVELVNDANCPQTRGTYTWSMKDGRLGFDVLDDPCPFDDLRAGDLQAGPWAKVDACIYRIQNLWPAALGCDD